MRFFVSIKCFRSFLHAKVHWLVSDRVGCSSPHSIKPRTMKIISAIWDRNMLMSAEDQIRSVANYGTKLIASLPRSCKRFAIAFIHPKLCPIKHFAAAIIRLFCWLIAKYFLNKSTSSHVLNLYSRVVSAQSCPLFTLRSVCSSRTLFTYDPHFHADIRSFILFYERKNVFSLFIMQFMIKPRSKWNGGERARACCVSSIKRKKSFSIWCSEMQGARCLDKP